ncbi:MAG TPA: septation ring formation regulator EzrA [Bacilli bacterium]|nr:septation ring formation regulator EzrA [Bacilli bacterium]
MSKMVIYIIAFTVAVFVFTVIFFLLVRNKKFNKLKKQLELLERERNLIVSTPIMSELAKMEVSLNNEELKQKYESWKNKFEVIKTKRYDTLTDMIIEVDNCLDNKDIKKAIETMTKLEMEIYKVKTTTDNLFDDIKEVTMSEQRNRSIVTKLKNRYRDLEKEFINNKDSYKDIYNYIELQFENIEKKFQDFENVMEENDYSETIAVVKVLDEMISHICVVVEETPDIVLLLENIIPSRIKEIKETYEKMLEKKYPLAYLKVEYNLAEIEKSTNIIRDKLKILNIENSMLELKTFLQYLDSLFNEFSHEKRSRKIFDETTKSFKEKIIKINAIVSDVDSQLDDIKNIYNLSNDDLVTFNDIKKELLDINNNYNTVIRELKSEVKPYSKLKNDIIFLSNRLKDTEISLDDCLKSLGSMQDDEMRAREQLDEITLLLKQCKSKMRTYKLPIVSNNYVVELSEANEANEEVIKELKKTPITIKTLNVRVDTARDLALKVYNTVNEMIKTAKLSEMIIVYGNRYRPLSLEINSGLDTASLEFFRGNYKESLEKAIKTIDMIEPDIYKKMLAVYSHEK